MLTRAGIVTSSKGVGVSLVERNISAGGRLATSLGTPQSGKERFQGRYKFLIWTAANKVRAVFANRYLVGSTTLEVPGPQPITVRKVAIEQGSSHVPMTFSGSRGITLAGGDCDIRTDLTAFAVVPGLAWLRVEADTTAGTNTYPVSSYYTTSQFEGGTSNVEQSLFYAPANEIDQIDGTGNLAIPTGASSQTGWAPVLLIGQVSPGVDAVIGIGDSISIGQNDTISSSGQYGGGFIRRAAYNASKPCLIYGVGGLAALHVTGSTSHPWLDSLWKYHTRAAVELGVNDLSATQTPAQLTANLKTIWALAKSNGIKKVNQTIITPRDSLTGALGTSLADQTPATNFTAGGNCDVFNASLPALVGTFVDGAYDVRTPIADPTTPQKWAIPTYASILAASALSTASAVSLRDAPSVGDSLVFSPGGGAGVQSTGIFRTLSVTGAGPYSALSQTPISVAQSSGAAVQATNTRDGLHPEPAANALMASALAAAFA